MSGVGSPGPLQVGWGHWVLCSWGGVPGSSAGGVGASGASAGGVGSLGPLQVGWGSPGPLWVRWVSLGGWVLGGYPR